MIRFPPTTAERPRERLQRLGPRALSVQELIALVLGSGGPGLPVEALARTVVQACTPAAGTSDGRLPRVTLEELTALPGMGPASACRLVAALELGRRMAARPRGETPPRIRGPEDVHRRMAPQLRDLEQEEFHALLLNTQHAVIREVLVTRGILDASLIHPREVFRPAIAAGAAALILVHNHPSGDPTPSAEDVAVTRQLEAAGRTLGIPVLDHVVIGSRGWRAIRGG
ncbi:MAG: DNA repair protein RadC [Longimicrobiales bacterium]|nr:DNA repair protein RadC [Longimicrobiales bacterium]